MLLKLALVDVSVTEIPGYGLTIEVLDKQTGQPVNILCPDEQEPVTSITCKIYKYEHLRTN